MNNTVRNNYKEVGVQFANFFYTTYDNNFFELVHVFEPDSKFTFLNHEVIGFNNLYTCLVEKFNVKTISHVIDDIKSQPIGDKTVVIQVKGRVSVNSLKPSFFVESFLLQYKYETDSFYCYSDIFTTV